MLQLRLDGASHARECDEKAPSIRRDVPVFFEVIRTDQRERAVISRCFHALFGESAPQLFKEGQREAGLHCQNALRYLISGRYAVTVSCKNCKQPHVFLFGLKRMDDDSVHCRLITLSFQSGSQEQTLPFYLIYLFQHYLSIRNCELYRSSGLVLIYIANS